MSNSDFINLLTLQENEFLESIKEKANDYFAENIPSKGSHLFLKISLKDLFNNDFLNDTIYLPTGQIQYNKEISVDIEKDFSDFYLVSLKTSRSLLYRENEYLKSISCHSKHIKEELDNLDYLINETKFTQINDIQLININLNQKYFLQEELLEIFKDNNINRFNIQDSFCIVISEKDYLSKDYLSKDFLIFYYLTNNFTVEQFMALKEKYKLFFDLEENVPNFFPL